LKPMAADAIRAVMPHLDGMEVHLKEVPKDPLAATAWGTKDFYVEDPDGYIICFGGRPSA